MQESNRREYRLKSELQEQILRHICKTRNADYKTISKETDRDRITILQSLDPLRKRHYIIAEKIDPSRKKSKLTFKPTNKGVLYSVAFLNITLDDIATAYGSVNEISKYSELVTNIKGDALRRQFQRELARRVVTNDLFDNNGKLIISSKEDYFKQGLRMALLETTKNKNYDPTNLFNIRTIDSLKNIYTAAELKELKSFYIKIRDNLNASIKLFPD